MKLRDLPPRPRKLVLASTDRTLETITPVAAGDPTIGGATLEVTNPTTLEQATMSLPAPGWTAQGTPAGSRGYRYEDWDQALGPCTAGKIDSRRTKLRCSGPGVTFSLDEPSQGGLSVILRTGTAALARCFFFGEIQKDLPGVFNARKAPRAFGCQ